MAERMLVGTSVPNMGPLTSLEITREVAERADRYDFSDLWVGDHIVFPQRIDSRYPYRHGFSSTPDEGVLEPLVSLGFLGGMTRRVRLGVSVLIVPYRNPVVTAKMIATLDVLTEGRVIYGAGVGWMEEEFDALEADYTNRGAISDEYLEIYKNLCATDLSSYSGKYYRYASLSMFPKPVQRPYPPVWIGGSTGRSMRRAARLGDGWQPLTVSAEEMRVKARRVREMLEEEGRNPATFTVSARVFYTVNDDPPLSPGVPSVYGNAEQVLDAMREYEEAGVDHLLMSPRGPDRRKTVEYVDRLGEVLHRL